jgi:hypothetical protein
MCVLSLREKLSSSGSAYGARVCIERGWGDGVGVAHGRQLRYFVDRLCDDLAYLRNRLHNADDGDGESEDSYDHIAPAVHNGHIPREWSAQH